MLRKISTNQIVTLGFIVLFIAFGAYFLYSIFTSIIRPLYLTQVEDTQNASLDTSLTEAVEYLKKREALTQLGRGDLTGSTPSATLTNETKYTAEVINGSGIAGAARTLADGLEIIGINAAQVGNTEEPVANTVIALKTKSEILRSSIVEKIGTKSAELRFEKLEDTYPFDIRIVIGK